MRGYKTRITQNRNYNLVAVGSLESRNVRRIALSLALDAGDWLKWYRVNRGRYYYLGVSPFGAYYCHCM